MPNVLIMEDNIALALEWREVFEMNGYNVVLEHDGDSAIERLETEKFDLVVTDLIIPKGRGGLSVIGKLRSMRKAAPACIVISGAKIDPNRRDDTNFFLRQAEKLGADVTLQKPIQGAEIVAVAGKLID